jgi:hypothetical protein
MERREVSLFFRQVTVMPTVSLLKKLLRSIPLGRKADPDVRAAFAADDPALFQKAYLAVLAKPAKRIRKQLKSRSLLAAWSVDSVDLNGRERELAASLDDLAAREAKHRLGKHKKGKVKKGRRSPAQSRFDEIISNWLVEDGSAPGPWETIAVAEILLREGRTLSPENFAQALAVLADAALRETSGSLFDVPTPVDEDDAIRQMIQQGESQWISSLLLGPLGSVQTLTKSATESLRKLLLESTDKDGLVHGSLLNQLPDWLAPITRCTFWANAFHQPLWRSDSAERLTLVAERTALFILPVQQHEIGDVPGKAGPSLAEIFEFLLPLAESTQEKRLVKLLKECRKPAGKVTRPAKPKKTKGEIDDEEVSPESVSSSKKKSAVDAQEKRKANRKPTEKKAVAEVSWQSDPSCVAILRSSLDADADAITLEWHSGTPQIMFAAAGVPVFVGSWTSSVQLDDEVLPAATAWKCSCWFLDPETIFVELESEDATVVKQMRHVLLAPCDRFALMTDSVYCKDPERRVQLTTSLPLASGALSAACDVTRELALSVGPRHVRTFPLWMEDDRIHHALGSYRESNGQLELAGIGKGGVTLPLALDWHPKRNDVPADWARCTVTESRRTVGSHEAGGFRIRVGDHQVLVYRSLTPPAVSRAVLGLHTWDESVYGRIPVRGGLLQPLVEVEYPE